jgi:hypothetical protein
MENMLSAGEINDFVGPQRFGKKARRARAASARMANKSKNNRLLEAFSWSRGTAADWAADCTIAAVLDI